MTHPVNHPGPERERPEDPAGPTVLRILDADEAAVCRRPAWRQRLVDAETGFRMGLRSGSTLVVSLFFGGAAVVMGLVLGLTGMEWAILSLSLGTALSAEFFHLLMTQVADQLRALNVSASRSLASLGTAAATAAQLTALAVTTILFWQHFRSLWPE